jgi:serine/threonine-protein kinase
VRAVALQVLGALEAAHRAGVIHRDIKPGNILLTSDGTAKVGDFGIAKTAEGLDHTATGMVVGTPSYLAPERITGDPATARSDIYATGWSCTRRSPAPSRSPTAARSPPQPPSARRCRPRWGRSSPGSTRRWQGAVERAMAKDPAARFDTAAAMAVALRDAAAPLDGTTTASPVSQVARTTVLPAEPPAAGPAPAEATARARPSSAAARPPRVRGPSTPSSPLSTGPRRARARGARRRRHPPRGGRRRVRGGGSPTGPTLPAELEERVRALEGAVEP